MVQMRSMDDAKVMHDIRHEALHSAEHPSIDGKIGMTLKPPRQNRGRPNVRDKRKIEQTENRTQVNFVKDNFLHINLNMILPIRLYTFMIKIYTDVHFMSRMSIKRLLFSCVHSLFSFSF